MSDSDRNDRFDRRFVLKGLGAVTLGAALFGGMSEIHSKTAMSRIAFGSCAYQKEPQPVWSAIQEAKPQLFAFLGDNVYADTTDAQEMQRAYDQFEARPEFQTFRRHVPIVGTWDDHDFAYNDAGAEIPDDVKKISKEMCLRLLREPKNTFRRKRDGVYASYFSGKRPQLVQVILLDLRWWKSRLSRDKSGSYIPDPMGTLLGEEQWRWLERQLSIPANVRFIGSSVQFASSEHPYEKWANYPSEKKRLLDLIDALNIRNAFVLSGDMHFAELTLESTPRGYPLYDLTASGLNQCEPIALEIRNTKRIAAYDEGSHFGICTIEWERRPFVTLEIRDWKGTSVLQKKILLPVQR